MKSSQRPLNGCHHILRVYLPAESAHERCGEVLEYSRRTGCREVLLFTSSYDKQPSFAPLSEIEGYARVLEESASRLRKGGMIVSVNVMQTLGHIYYPQSAEETFGFRRRVYADGRTSGEGACPLCEKLRSWACLAYRLYASIEPRVLFVDDDFRTVMQGISCFCEAHLEG